MSSSVDGSAGYAAISRLCGALTAALGGLGLVGWVLGEPFWTGLGTDKVPMAPITAVFFLGHGATLALCAGPSTPRRILVACAALHVAGALLAAALSGLSAQGVHLEFERLGFSAQGSVAGQPIGHISPISGFGFVIASVSFLAAIPASKGSVAWVMTTLWTAAILLASFFAFLLAYGFGAPLLYGGVVIPPAVTTCVAFLVLGAGLVALAARHGVLRRGQLVPAAASRPVPAFATFAGLAAIVVGSGYLYFRAQEKQHRVEISRELTSIAEMKSAELHQYRLERIGDGLVFFHNAAFADLVNDLFDNPNDTGSRSLIHDWLDRVREHYKYDRLSLLDSLGHERVVVPESASPMSRVVEQETFEALREAEMDYVDFYRSEFDGRVYLDIVVPIIGKMERRLGTLTLRIDPESQLYPMLRKWPVPSASGEARLVRREGRSAVILSDLRAHPEAPLNLRFPLDAQYSLAALAATGKRGVLEGLDYRGVASIAAVREVPDSPWLLLASMSQREAYQTLRQQMWTTIALVVAVLSTAGIAVGFTWRQQRARFYRAKYEAELERAWLRDVLARSLNEVYIFDAESLRFSFVNEGACRNLGYTAEELARMTPLDIKPEFVAESFRATLRPLRKGDRELVVFETVHRRKDGSEYPVEVHLQYLPGAGRPVYLAMVNDISERQQVEAQLRQAQKMEAVGRLAGGVAHDFNNQVFVINGYCELLLAEAAGRPEFEVPLAEIKKASERAAALTAQLLAFSRKQVLQPRVLDLDSEIAGIETMLRRLMGERIEVQFIPGAELATVRVDPTQFQQVVMNLVVNSRDAMPDGGKLTIATRNVDLDAEYVQTHPEATAGPHVMVSISDTGHGMDRETLSHLFEPFFTTKEPGKGTGLGLATAYGIAKQSGGHITAYSELNRGATFRVYLPRVSETADTSGGETPTVPIAARGTETILLAEDEPAVRDLLHRVLSEHGYEVLCASNGREAVAIAESCRRTIDLLLTDVIMPEMVGSEVAEHVIRLHPECRVLYISGYAEDAVVNHGVLAEGLEFLSKPCPTDVVLRRVREILDTRGPAVGLSGRRILIVDDSVDDRTLLGHVLGRVGCEVLHAGEGGEALRILERETVDAVLTDINMPAMDGLELVRAIRARPNGSDLPVIVLSGAGDYSDEERSHAAGATACVSKGIAKPKELLDLLASTLTG